FQLAPCVEQREHHDRLAQSHVIGQAAAEIESPKKRKPAECFPLILTERSLKRAGRIFGDDPAETVKLGSDLCKRLVVTDGRLCREQGVEKRRLRALEPN